MIDLVADTKSTKNAMIIQAHTFADPQTRKKTTAALAKGQKVIVVLGPEHDENVLNKILSSSKVRQDIQLGRSVRAAPAPKGVVGGVVGGAIGLTAGIVVDHLTQTHPAAGLLGKLALAAVGAVVGREVAKESSVELTYDPQTRSMTSRLKR
jgi:hypothetical protein